MIKMPNSMSAGFIIFFNKSDSLENNLPAHFTDEVPAHPIPAVSLRVSLLNQRRPMLPSPLSTDHLPAKFPAREYR